MSKGRGIGKIVDRHKFEIGIVHGGAKNVASNAAEAVDTYFDCHEGVLSWNYEGVAECRAHRLTVTAD